MQVGDLVRHYLSRSDLGVGIVVDFDNDKDPIIQWCDGKKAEAWHEHHVEVINESR